MPDPSLPQQNNFQPDSWSSLRNYTAARIALGRAGTSVPVRESLKFKLAHAHARDAVYSTLDLPSLTNGLRQFGLPLLEMHSQTQNRRTYLQRPDLGRRLNDASLQTLSHMSSAWRAQSSDIALILAGGLSATAINDHAVNLLEIIIPQFRAAGLTLAPITVVEHARVAISDEIGFLLKSRLSLILIGERPGLSSPNSMGIYLTYGPHPGLTDETRNCISNIRPEGLSYEMAAEKAFYLVSQSLNRKVSGIALKDETKFLS
ncbi:MAG: ethanolamine ammonia-lyase subunit EutC [Bacteroidota bacterium]